MRAVLASEGVVGFVIARRRKWCRGSSSFLPCLFCGLMLAWGSAPVHAAQTLPTEVKSILQRAGVPDSGMRVVVQEVGNPRALLRWQPEQAFNPASLTKLLTTMAALERLGPAFNWSTPVWISGQIRDGVLEGSVYIKGQGDPSLVLERVWLLLRQLQQAGVREIRGDIVLDNSAFSASEEAPGEFDGETLRPYNVKPAALLMSFRSVAYRFVPDLAAGVARVQAEPGLAGLKLDRSVPLAPGGCGDWRATLKAAFEPGATRFSGRFPAACGERWWLVADPDPNSFEQRLISALWAEMGGRLSGSARAGAAPADSAPSFEFKSPALAEVVRDINKFSNNVMAQQLFLSLALQDAPNAVATPAAARAWMTHWILARTGEVTTDSVEPGDTAALLIDNGSGLSRHTRISAQRLARLLQQAYDSPVMSELMSSLPISGVDGTLRRSRATPGRAHLKTGSLRDVTAVAGYVLSDSGRRYVVVAGIHHAQAQAARPALDALVQWVLRDAPSR